MRKILIASMALLPLAGIAQTKPAAKNKLPQKQSTSTVPSTLNSFVVNGDIKGLKTGDKIYLIHAADGQNMTDSATVTNGIFNFKGSVADPVRGSLFLNKNPYVTRPAQGEKLDMLSLYLEPGTTKLTASDSLKNAVITGSVINDDDKKLKTLSKPVADQLAAINGEYSKFTDEQKKDKKLMEDLGNRYDKVAEGLSPILLTFAKNNPKSYVSLSALAQLVSNPDQSAEAEKAFATLSPALKATKQGTMIAQLFDAAKKTAVGVMAMDFTQNDPDGKPVSLSSFKGKYVLVDFWASWCAPCRQENPNVVAAYNKFKDKGFTVLGVSLDQPGKHDAWTKAIADDKLTWTHVSDLKYWNNEVAVMYGIRSIPANFLIDPTGKIIAKGLREQALQDKLQELLGSKSK